MYIHCTNFWRATALVLSSSALAHLHTLARTLSAGCGLMYFHYTDCWKAFERANSDAFQKEYHKDYMKEARKGGLKVRL